MQILKNIAFLYSGKPKRLKSLQHNCNAIHEILERNHEWKVLVNRPLESDKRLREDFENCKTLKIENLFIFYTGHGIAYGKHRKKLKLSLLDDDYNVQILLNAVLEKFNTLPKRTVIVLDSCYSGKFIYNAERFSDSIEIVTSSLPHLKSSGVNKASNLSLFSHYFCEAIEQLSFKNETVNFKNIIQYINAKNEQKCIYLPPTYTENKEMILCEDTLLYQLLQELQGRFISFEQMRKKTLKFVDAYDLSFDAFVNTENFFELFSILLKNKQYLKCLLKEFNIDFGTFLEIYDEDCKILKKRALNTKEITMVILKIRPKTGKSLDECRVGGWLKYNTDTYKPMKLTNDVMNFTETNKSNYKTLLAQELRYLKGKNCSTPMELNLILHEELFGIDFKNLEIFLDDEPTSLIENFSITTQFEFRYTNINQPIRKITAWKNNSKRYQKSQNKKIQGLVYPLYVNKPSKLFGKRFNNSDCVILTSNYTLLNNNLKTILTYGIPHIICPQTSINVACNLEWEERLVKDMKEIFIDYIDEAYENEDSIHFIYDNYHKVDSLKQALNETTDNSYDDLKG